MTNPKIAPPTVTKRCSIAPRTASRYLVFKNSITGLCHSLTPLLNSTPDTTGATSTENRRAPRRANATVQAIGWNKRPSTRCRVKMGKYAVMMIAIAKKTGRSTSCAASRMRNVRIGFHGKLMKRDRSPPKQKKGRCEDQESVVQGKIYKLANHLLLHSVLEHQRVLNDLYAGFDPGNHFLHVSRKHLP